MGPSHFPSVSLRIIPIFGTVYGERRLFLQIYIYNIINVTDVPKYRNTKDNRTDIPINNLVEMSYILSIAWNYLEGL